MIGGIGFAATGAGALAAMFGALAGLAALGTSRGRTAFAVASAAAIGAFALLTVAVGAMIAGLVGHDFSIAYVAQVGSRETPVLFTVASLWGALEGSILFWGWLLAAVSVLLLVRMRGVDDRARLPGGLAVLLALTAFFAFVVVGPANPWVRASPVPLNGPGPNPLLQDHPLMAFHPPLLYLGFVGLAVPFALTVDALVRGRLDDGWLRLARAWTLLPWALLTLGLVAGAWWSYAVLGWGGYWAWDPVENVALLPWLTSTAFLHSAMVGRRGGSLLAWNVALVVSSFALTLFATLVTRSGVLDSVHAFTRSAIGPLFVGLLGVTLVGTIGLAALRLPPSSEDVSLGARGRAVLLNNLMLAAIAATVLVGTVYPLFAEAAAGIRVSVGAPYFERIIGPLAGGLLVLAAIGPTLPWGVWTARARRSLAPGAAAAAAAAVAAVAMRSDAGGVVGSAVGGFALGQSAWLLGRRLSRVAGRGGNRGIVRRASPQAVGGLIAHAGVGLLALALVASSTGRREVTITLRQGEAASALGRTVAFVASAMRPGPNRTVIEARLEVRDASGPTTIRPALNVFATSSQAIATPAILAGPVEDVYVTLLNLDVATGVATVRVGRRPLASWIWPAGALVALGGVLAAVPAGRRSAGAAEAATADTRTLADAAQP